MKTTVIYHSADFDGIFCREIAKKFLGETDVEYIGWNHGDKKIVFPYEGTIYILDLSPECLGGDTYDSSRIIWIDHHKSSIERWPDITPGYRIDGVAACRLAWQWFTNLEIAHGRTSGHLADKLDFIDRKVSEPLAVRLAGEYDIWDKRDPNAELFQFGLRSRDMTHVWQALLHDVSLYSQEIVAGLVDAGESIQRYQQEQDASRINEAGFIIEWENLKFLAYNTTRCNSLTFAAKDVPETGHDALLAFGWTGQKWKVSMYHAKHRTDLDLSKIASWHGGGGHRGACGFQVKELPFEIYL